MNNEIPKLYSEKEAAALLTIGASTLQRKRIAGEISFIRINGNCVRYKFEHLEKYLNSRERNSKLEEK